jgi:phosphotriesterase-related protein
MAEASLQVMTVLGPVADLDDLGTVLPVECILCDHTALATQGAVDEEIKLETLGALRYAPCSNLRNLRLDNGDDACRELGHLGTGTHTVVDVTAVSNGRDVHRLADISKRTGVHIIMGTTVQRGPAMTEVETIAKALNIELLVGIKEEGNSLADARQAVRAGIIGSIDVLSSMLTDWEVLQLQAAAMSSKETGAAIFIHLMGMASPSATFECASVVLELLEAAGALPARILFSNFSECSECDEPHFLKLLGRGACICVTPIGNDYIVEGGPTTTQTAVLLCKLLQHTVHQEQILVSNYAHMMLQYQKYGGMGYSFLQHKFLPMLSAMGVTDEQMLLLTHSNAARLLAWWTRPPVAEVPKHWIKCSWCVKPFEPIEGEYFSKFQYVYCGTKCLKKHRKSSWKDLPEATAQARLEGRVALIRVGATA